VKGFALKLLRIVAVLAASTFTLIPPATGADADEITTLSVRSGHSFVLAAPQLSRIAVGDGRIAGVITIGGSEVIVNGKTAGRTTLFVWRGNRRYTYEVSVSEQSIDDVAAMLRSTLMHPNVQVVSFDRSIVMRGKVDRPEDMASLDRTLARFQPDAKANKYTLINAVSVVHPLGALQADLAGVSGGTDIQVDHDEKGNLVVSGSVSDRATAERVLDRARASGGISLGADAKVIDRLAVTSNSQIDIKVYILEVDQTAMSQLGIRLQSGTPDVNHPGNYILGAPSFPALESPNTNFSGAPNSGPGIIGRALNIGAFLRTTILAPTLDLLMQNGHAKMLSSPDLVTMPGRQATFLVGGQIPIPYASGPGQIAIEYKDFGVRLDITPQILGDGSVRTKIAPEVSDLDFQDAVIVSGFSIPALKTSKLATEVVTQSGESIIMGGLLRRVQQRNIIKIPLLGDLPILGKLFRSTSYQNAETDVVFIMTPQVITR
jgi:pilus assembly protein CpaC